MKKTICLLMAALLLLTLCACGAKKEAAGEEAQVFVMGIDAEYPPFSYIDADGSYSGFDVEVLRQATRFKKLGKGLLPYLLGIFAALKNFRALPVEITLDGKTEKTEPTGKTEKKASCIKTW